MPDELNVYARFIDFIPEGYVPSGWVAAVECLDSDGDPVLVVRRSQETTAWQAMGMAMSLADDLRDNLRTPPVVYVEDGEDD